MRALILSDIHANLEALEAVLAAAPEHDAVWNLGDVVGYGASPNEVIEKVRSLDHLVVRGNHDRACCDPPSLEFFSATAASAVRWTQRVLTPENLAWLQHLAPGPVSPAGRESVCVHGSPYHEDEYLFTLEDTWESFHANPARIIFFGHTHRQEAFATNQQEQFHLKPQYSSAFEPDQCELTLRKGARYLLNPGSVGQPRDGDRRAAFALYDDARELLTWFRVPYELEKAQEKILRAGLPDYLAERLASGR